jgi:hypothetical protein
MNVRITRPFLDNSLRELYSAVKHPEISVGTRESPMPRQVTGTCLNLFLKYLHVPEVPALPGIQVRCEIVIDTNVSPNDNRTTCADRIIHDLVNTKFEAISTRAWEESNILIYR